MEKNISVLMSVYRNDIAENVRTAVESVYNQTLKPKQIVMVVDGPVPEDVTKVLEELKKEIDVFEVYAYEKNSGLGTALKRGTEFCKYEYIARMDSDDISLPDRFEKQMKKFEEDPELSLVGSNSQEFIDTLDNLANVKALPEKHEDIVEFMKGRCPFVHPTVIMKKDMLLKAGGYEYWHYAEDYYMWVRMYLAGAKFYNIQENLINFRININTYKRRGGLKYYKSIRGLLKFIYKNKMIGFMKYTKEKIKRFVGHVLVPSWMKNALYMKFMRTKRKDA